MKKLLGLLGSLGMVASTGATVISCGNKNTEEKKPEKIGKVSLEMDTLSIKGESTTLTVELDKDIANNDIISVTSNKGENTFLKIEETKKETKKVTYKITLEKDLVENKASEVLTAKLNNEEIGNVEINLNRKEFDLKLIEDAINQEGVAGFITGEFGNKGKLSIEPGKIKEQASIIESVKLYVNKVIEGAKAFGINYNISVDEIVNMVNIDFLDSAGAKINEDNTKVISSIKITVKEGHENDIKGFIVLGEAKVNVSEKKNVEIVSTDLGQVTGSSENESIILGAVKEAFVKLNTEAKDAVNNGDLNFEIKKYDDSNKSGTVQVTNKFNSSIKLTNDKLTITFNYKVDENMVSELDIKNFVFKGIDSVTLFSEDEVSNDNIVKDLFENGFGEQLTSDDSFFANVASEAYGFNEDEFKEKFLEIFNINIASDQSSFQLSVKKADVFQKVKFVGGPITISIIKN